VESYITKEKKRGRPTKEEFDPYRDIAESVHRTALDAAFSNGSIANYADYVQRLKDGYAQQGIKLGYNKAVKVATFLSNKRMVTKDGKE
ncbi:UNVERIFIED_CONTAM: mobilization protein, partial [Prevotella sp. 15_C9]